MYVGRSVVSFRSWSVPQELGEMPSEHPVHTPFFVGGFHCPKTAVKNRTKVPSGALVIIGSWEKALATTVNGSEALIVKGTVSGSGLVAWRTKEFDSQTLIPQE